MFISIPVEYVNLCIDWHGGQSSIMYAIASTGNLTRGTIRPQNDNDEWMTDDEWLCHLYYELSCELWSIVDGFDCQCIHNDNVIIVEFLDWVENKIVKQSQLTN